MDFQNTEKKLPKTSYNDRLFARFETKTSGMTVELKEIEEFLVYWKMKQVDGYFLLW